MPMRRSWAGARMPCAGADTTLSAMRITPPSASSSPAMQRSVVVLPHPDGPSSDMNSPLATVNEMPCTTVTVP